MRRLHPSRFAVVALTGVGLAITPADAQPRGKAPAVTRADIDRLDKKIEDQQRRIDKLIKLQLQYMQMLSALSEGTPPPVVPEPKTEPKEPKADNPKPADPKPVAATAEPKARPAAAIVAPKPMKPKAEAMGNIVGKVTGAAPPR